MHILAHAHSHTLRTKQRKAEQMTLEEKVFLIIVVSFITYIQDAIDTV